MFCINCGKKLNDDYNFCPYCGFKLTKDTKTKGTLVNVMVKGGLTKELYYKDGNFYYDSKLEMPFSKEELYKMGNPISNMFFISSTRGFNPLIGPMVYGYNTFKKKR